MKFNTVRMTVFAVALAASAPAMVAGQDVRDQPRAAENRADYDFDFGWIGLLGLVGFVWTETARPGALHR